MSDLIARGIAKKVESQLADTTQDNVKIKYSAKGNANYYETISKKFFEDQQFTKEASNDTVAFQNAALSGKRIEIPSGEYMINGTLNFNPYTRFIANGKVTFIITSDVTVMKLCYKNQVYGIDFDVTKVLPYTKDIIEISSATMQGKTAWDWKVDIRLEKLSLATSNVGDFVNGTFFNIWAARIDPDGVTQYDRAGFWGITIKDIDAKGYFGNLCRNWAYQHTGVTDDGWITGISFKNININSFRYGFFGSRSEADMDNLKYRDAGNLVIDNVQMQCDGSKRFGFFTGLGKSITNSIPWDWHLSKNGVLPFLIQYRTNYQNSKLTFDYGYNKLESLVEVNGAPSYMSATEKSNWVKSSVSKFTDAFNDQVSSKMGTIRFQISGGETMPLWTKVTEFTSKNGQFTTGFMINGGYFANEIGIGSIALTVSDSSRLDSAVNPVLSVVTLPYIPTEKLFEFYVTKRVNVADSTTTYAIYMKLVTNTMGAGFYYTPFSAYGEFNSPVYLEKLSAIPSGTLILAVNKNISYLYKPKLVDGDSSVPVTASQAGTVVSHATVGSYIDVTFRTPFKTGTFPRVAVTARSTDPTANATTALATATGFRLYCTHSSISCDYVASVE